MPEQKTLTGSLEMRYTPDEYTATEKADGASWPLGAGYWDLGFVADGAFFVIRRIHGGEANKLFKLAEESGYTPPEPKQQQSEPDASALADRIAALEAAQREQQQSPPSPPADADQQQQG